MTGPRRVMKHAGSVYVSAVFVALAGYFTYQSWFNPQRTIKRQLGELAAALSVPADHGSEIERLSRTSAVGKYLASDAAVRLGPSGPAFATRDGFLTAYRAWNPSSGATTIDFVDVQVTLDSATEGRAFMTVEITGLDSRTGELARDRHEARLALGLRDGVWVVTKAEPAAAGGAPVATEPP